MINILTKVIALFASQPDIAKMGFLSSFFRVTPDSFTDAEYADLDEIYEGEEIAPVVTDLSTGAVTIVEEKFVNKQIPFPVYAIKSPAQIAALMNRQPGESAYVAEKVNWLARLAKILVRKFARMTNMIRRSMEQQAAQVLQTGSIVLTDEHGHEAFSLSFQTSHFPVATTPWADIDHATPLDDIDQLADLIRDEGLTDVENLVFGSRAWINFIKNKDVQLFLKKDGIPTGELSPVLREKGAKFMGWLDYSANRYYFWTYNARYNLFKREEKIKYLDPDNVIFLPNPESLYFIRIFGGIPTVRADIAAIEQLFGADKVQIGGEYDIRPRVWWSDDNEAYIAEIKSRPLMLPVSIKKYGCLKTAI